MRKRILLVDTLNSCFYLKHAGELNVLWTFLSDIRTIANRFKIDKVLFAYEGKGGSVYRKTLYPEYKYKRKQLREKATYAEKRSLELFMDSYTSLIHYAPMFGIKTINVPGAEADDTIAFIVNTIDLDKFQIMILSSDTDLNQLLRPGVVQTTYGKELTQSIWRTRNIPSSIWKNTDKYYEEYSITPKEYAFAKALSGDTSDSITGFEGIGPKIALALIQKYKTLDGVQQNINSLDVPRLQKKSIEHMKQNFNLAYRNYDLINLNWGMEKYLEILSEEGVEKLINFMSEIPTPSQVSRDQILELCYEYGRLDIANQLDFWLHTFCK